MKIRQLMQKHRVLLTAIAVLIPVLVFLIFRFGLLSAKEPFYIAIAGPMSGQEHERGTAMVRGAQLLLDQVNREGGVHGRRVELLVYDDQNDPELAHQIAQEIVHKSRARVVLGHFFSSTSITAGQVYQAEGIASISGSATADVLTENNDWFFRTIPSNRSQAAFLGYYAHQVLGHQTAGIIYDGDAYGESLMRGFERSFQSVGGDIKYKWRINSAAPNQDAVLDNIVRDLLQLQAQQAGPSTIFLATHVNDAVELLRQRKRKGLAFPFIAGDEMGDANAARRFEQYREEQVSPGYFTDGLYATSPIIFDVAGDRAQQFYLAFVKAYGEVPGWTAATYYDAAQMAVAAIRRSGSQNERLKAARHRLRDALSKINTAEAAIDGVIGPLYFDRQGNIQNAVAIGVFKHQRFISGTTQMYPVTDLSRPGWLEQQWQNREISLVDGRYMHKTNVVYTGIDLNRVHDIERNGSSYTVDFYLWFRSHRDVDPSRIEFVNALKKTDKSKQIALGEPIAKTITGDMAYRLYRLKETFSASFNLRDYPFDTQNISIQFRHADLTRDRIVYVADLLGMGELTQDAMLQKYESTNVFESVWDWQISGAHFYQDTMRTQSTLGSPDRLDLASSVDYSRFNLVIEIKREVGKFVMKSLLPVVFVISLAYLGFFLPTAYAETLIAILTGTVLSVVFFHSDLSKQLDVGYSVALDFAFYVIYGLLVLELIIAILILYSKHREVLLRRLILAGKIVYPLVMVSTACSLYAIYGDFSRFEPRPTVPSASTAMATFPSPDSNQTSEAQTVLTLSSWRADDAEYINRVLDQFHAAHPHITIRYEPMDLVQYRHLLVRQLKAGIAPDLFYILPYGRARQLFDDGFLEPLGDLTALQEHFDAEARELWATDDGVPYGVPFFSGAIGLYYNTSLFERLGVPIPTTWHALLQAAETLKQHGVIPFANTSKAAWNVAELLFMNLAPAFIGGREGRLQYARGERCFDDEHTVAAFEAMKALEPYLPPSHGEMTYHDSQQLFLHGKAAMWFAGSTEISFFESADPNFEWRLSSIPAPAGQENVVVVSLFAAIGLNSASPHKAAAKTFLSWLSTPDAAALIGQELSGFLPLHRAAPKPDSPHMQSFLTHLDMHQRDVAWVWPRLMAGNPAGYTLLEEIAPQVLTGKMTPQQGAGRFQQGLSIWFEPAQRCRIPDLAQHQGFEAQMRRFIDHTVKPVLEQTQMMQTIQAQNDEMADLSPVQIEGLGKDWLASVGKREVSVFLASLVQQSRGLYTSMMVLDAKGLPVGFSRMPNRVGTSLTWPNALASDALQVSPIRFDRAAERWHMQVSWPLVNLGRSRPFGWAIVSINPAELRTHYCWRNAC